MTDNALDEILASVDFPYGYFLGEFAQKTSRNTQPPLKPHLAASNHAAAAAMNWGMIVRAAFIAMALLLCSAAEARYTHREINGTWWSQSHDGEGFVFDAYQDGLVIGYWYTYDPDGNQQWMIGVGEPYLGRIEFDMYITEGGRMASPDDLKNTQRTQWGVVTMDVYGCYERSRISYYSYLDGSEGGYWIEPMRGLSYNYSNCWQYTLPEPGAIHLFDDDLHVELSLPYVVAETVVTYDRGIVRPLKDLCFKDTYPFRVTKVEAWDETGTITPTLLGIETGIAADDTNDPSADPFMQCFDLWTERTGGKDTVLRYRITTEEHGVVFDYTVTYRTTE